jgi:hypothetical protein
LQGFVLLFFVYAIFLLHLLTLQTCFFLQDNNMVLR